MSVCAWHVRRLALFPVCAHTDLMLPSGLSSRGISVSLIFSLPLPPCTPPPFNFAVALTTPALRTPPRCSAPRLPSLICTSLAPTFSLRQGTWPALTSMTCVGISALFLFSFLLRAKNYAAVSLSIYLSTYVIIHLFTRSYLSVHLSTCFSGVRGGARPPALLAHRRGGPVRRPDDPAQPLSGRALRRLRSHVQGKHRAGSLRGVRSRFCLCAHQDPTR